MREKKKKENKKKKTISSFDKTILLMKYMAD